MTKPSTTKPIPGGIATMSGIITAAEVDLGLAATNRQQATRQLAERLVAAGRVTDLEGFLTDVAKREGQMPTGIEGGIGIPHARSSCVTEPSLAFGRSTEGIDFGADDGPAHLIFLIAAPDGEDNAHMKILAALARRLMHAEFRQALHDAGDPATVAGLINREVLGK